MVTTIQDKDKAPIREAILKVLTDCYPHGKKTSEIESILDSEGYNRSSVATKINKLLQENIIVGEGHPKTYCLKDKPKQYADNPLAAALNTNAPKSPDAIKPMDDDEWQREVGKVEANRPWTHLSFQEIFRMADDAIEGYTSWDVIGKAVFLYAKFMAENNKAPTLDDIPDKSKDVLRAVKHLISYPFVMTNEEYAYGVIVNNWKRGHKGERAMLNPHFKELENRIQGKPTDD